MWGPFYLTDRGIRQAIERGMLEFDPPLEERQIQPASVDLFFDKIEELWPLDELLDYNMHVAGARRNEISPKSEVELRTTQRMQWAEPLSFKTELRSSLRRLACHVRMHGWTMMGHKNRIHVEMINPGNVSIRLSPGDKIAQLLFYFRREPGVGYHEAGLSGFEDVARGFYELEKIDHGHLVGSYERARKLIDEGFFSVTPGAKIDELGRLKVHAGKTASVLRKNVLVDFSSKSDISDCFEEVKLPYRLMPGEHIVIVTNERLKLSKHIGMHFYDHLVDSDREISLLTAQTERLVADRALWHIPDGWVDPGYKGVFTRQPKTYYPAGVVINEGDVLGHGLIIFYPKGVERPYGSQELGSHYQNADEMKLTQK